MSKLSINQASKLFKVSRNTIYARIKKGEITKDSDGFVSVQDMVRLFGNRSDKKATEKQLKNYWKVLNNRYIALSNQLNIKLTIMNRYLFNRLNN